MHGVCGHFQLFLYSPSNSWESQRYTFLQQEGAPWWAVCGSHCSAEEKGPIYSNDRYRAWPWRLVNGAPVSLLFAQWSALGSLCSASPLISPSRKSVVSTKLYWLLEGKIWQPRRYVSGGGLEAPAFVVQSHCSQLGFIPCHSSQSKALSVSCTRGWVWPRTRQGGSDYDNCWLPVKRDWWEE